MIINTTLMIRMNLSQIIFVRVDGLTNYKRGRTFASLRMSQSTNKHVRPLNEFTDGMIAHQMNWKRNVF